MEERHGIPGIHDEGHALQILATEHWSLLATRSMSWNEVFARSGLYLTVLSSSVVAIALVAQATGFDHRFVVFALVLLPVVFFVGITTIVEIAYASADDPFLVAGMNRLRHAYLEIEPGLSPYFVTSQFDDPAGLLVTFGAPPGAQVSTRAAFARGFVTTPGMLSVVNSVVLGVIGGVVLLATGASEPIALVSGGIAFLVGLAVNFALLGRFVITSLNARQPAFPGGGPAVTSS